MVWYGGWFYVLEIVCKIVFGLAYFIYVSGRVKGQRKKKGGGAGGQRGRPTNP